MQQIKLFMGLFSLLIAIKLVTLSFNLMAMEEKVKKVIQLEPREMEILSSDPAMKKFLGGKKILSLIFNKQLTFNEISIDFNSENTLTVTKYTSGPKINITEAKINELIVTNEPLEEIKKSTWSV